MTRPTPKSLGHTRCTFLSCGLGWSVTAGRLFVSRSRCVVVLPAVGPTFGSASSLGGVAGSPKRSWVLQSLTGFLINSSSVPTPPSFVEANLRGSERSVSRGVSVAVGSGTGRTTGGPGTVTTSRVRVPVSSPNPSPEGWP